MPTIKPIPQSSGVTLRLVSKERQEEEELVAIMREILPIAIARRTGMKARR